MSDLRPSSELAASEPAGIDPGNPSRTTPEAVVPGRFSRSESPWLNPKLLWGAGLLLLIVLIGLVGRFAWDPDLVFTGSGPLNLPPLGFENLRGQGGVAAHPLGTQDSGRDILALLIIGAPNTLMIGLIASTIGMTIGIALGFTAGFVGGRVDDVIRILSDVMITIPPLMVLIVFQAALGDVGIVMMALLISGFVWQSPTRLIRAQALSMRESGYVKMARLSGASTFHIMFREMLPNLIPYLFGSFIASVTTSIVTAVGLETLGLGPQRVPTLGRTIYEAINAAALLRNMWWWWGFPTLLLCLIFIALLLVNLGLDEVSNPRLRKGGS